MSKKTAKSKRIVYPNWKDGRALLATREIKCCGFRCKRQIQPGEYYTLHVLKSTGLYEQHPICDSCMPFTEVERDAPDTHLEWYRDCKHTHSEYEARQSGAPYVSLR